MALSISPAIWLEAYGIARAGDGMPPLERGGAAKPAYEYGNQAGSMVARSPLASFMRASRRWRNSVAIF